MDISTLQSSSLSSENFTEETHDIKDQRLHEAMFESDGNGEDWVKGKYVILF